ncbi:EAL domain-containing protein [Porphyrobacter algicida]|uniref:EAL domain-containing protein n=1 Tax=Qipengyuania algicida TaxID=1836209 RepID=A0A845AE78_9SPHN|nr:EAL domain-containing protein [Qipengyuania algicida]MXP27699.1 EAL domain-containing protein [Qipengyuania algicida]
MVEDTDISGSRSGSKRAIFGLSLTRWERVKHALWAGAIALVMAMVFLFEPLDQTLWLTQSRISPTRVSGNIVFVQAGPNITDPEYPLDRAALAKALDKMRQDGVEKVYLNLVFDQPSSPAVDAQLAKAVSKWGPRLVFVDRLKRSIDGKLTPSKSIQPIAGKQPRVEQGIFPNYLGFAWSAPYNLKVGSNWERTFEASLGDANKNKVGEFPINYSFASASIPSFSLTQFTSSANRNSIQGIAGKTVVIGAQGISGTSELKIPGQPYAPPSLASIFAAETLRMGGMPFIPSVAVVIAFSLLLLVCVAYTSRKRQRQIAYVLCSTVPLATFFIAAVFGWRIELSYTVPVLVFYALFRSRTRWKKRVALIDQETGLPTLRALDAWISNGSETGHVVVAKIHGYENVVKTFGSGDRASYVLKLVDRMRATDTNLQIYFDGHYLAWHTNEEAASALIEHLEGLRAIFAAPVSVAGHTVDVGITFGAADMMGDRHRSLAAATAAAEETSEAHQPIKLAKSSTDHDHFWDLSLRARIDEAMKAGEIYCVYQPKLDIVQNRLIGVEALVRWQDPVKGFISPMHFIMQCEKAGRMEHLTRYVLQSACSAGQLLHFRGTKITMSVNVSATLLCDMRIVGLVRNVLQATGFSPEHLVLEITETARVGDLETADVIIRQLKALGTKISMDDFGVGAANFEALHALPFDEVKIDRRFVADASDNPKARAIVSSILALGRESRIAIVAEGAETDQDLDMLRLIGCTQVQGYAISRPISLTNLLEKYVSGSERQARNMV